MNVTDELQDTWKLQCILAKFTLAFVWVYHGKPSQGTQYSAGIRIRLIAHASLTAHSALRDWIFPSCVFIVCYKGFIVAVFEFSEERVGFSTF